MNHAAGTHPDDGKTIHPQTQKTIQPRIAAAVRRPECCVVCFATKSTAIAAKQSLAPSTRSLAELWNLHEFGGVVTKKRRKLKRHRFRVGEHSGRSVSKQPGQICPHQSCSPIAQASRATRLIEEENERRGASKATPLSRTPVHETCPRLPTKHAYRSSGVTRVK